MAPVLSISQQRVATAARLPAKGRTSRVSVLAQSQRSPAPSSPPAGSLQQHGQHGQQREHGRKPLWAILLPFAVPSGAQAAPEEEEWKRLFGAYLDPAEEAKAWHNMYVSHAWEEKALAPPGGKRH